MCGHVPGAIPRLDLDSFVKQVELYAAQGSAADRISGSEECQTMTIPRI